jgi:type II secretory pathway component GspD/PulD (secretin)
MKIHLFTLLAIPALCLSAAIAQEPAAAPAADSTPKPGVYDYQDLPINDVLRELGRAAKINLVIGNNVNGNLTFHVENKTPLQVIDAIAEQRNLLFKDFEGSYYIVTNDDWREIMRNRFYFEVPELPAAIAKYQKRYYDALVKEGFTKDEALKIIMSQPLPPRDLRFNN